VTGITLFGDEFSSEEEMDYYHPLELKLVDFILNHNESDPRVESERPLPVSATKLLFNLAASAAERPISGKPSKDGLPKIPKVRSRSTSQSRHQSKTPLIVQPHPTKHYSVTQCKNKH
jgi:hypothetical protein